MATHNAETGVVRLYWLHTELSGSCLLLFLVGTPFDTVCTRGFQVLIYKLVAWFQSSLRIDLRGGEHHLSSVISEYCTQYETGYRKRCEAAHTAREGGSELRVGRRLRADSVEDASYRRSLYSVENNPRHVWHVYPRKPLLTTADITSDIKEEWPVKRFGYSSVSSQCEPWFIKT